jgi:hypothetical protein
MPYTIASPATLVVHDGVDAEHHGGDTERDDHPLEAAVGTDAER